MAAISKQMIYYLIGTLYFEHAWHMGHISRAGIMMYSVTTNTLYVCSVSGNSSFFRIVYLFPSPTQVNGLLCSSSRSVHLSSGVLVFTF
ncbi:hypothetical protein CEXT_435101 [Caerostris extrusa]|uniref:Uncharacterized protein n=1 Tax=Caerostris extrusa TaxID=172846 RepID=A0AAV4RNA0_CAEEX|nr:hypothetical protein CEXT_435101 [Caerostris extrusa]